MPHAPWVSGPGGLRGPRYLVDQAEWEIRGYLAVREEGFGIAERPEPLLTALLLAGVAHWLGMQVREWLAAFQRGAGEPRGRPFFVDD